MRTIAIEEHFSTPAFLAGPGKGLVDRASPVGRYVGMLGDVGAGRIAAMDEAGIDVQVLSLTQPGIEPLSGQEAISLAKDSNEFLAEVVREHPTRFSGFAVLPTAEPLAAADELERSVRELGFVGAMINGHCQGRRLDDEYFWPILERAEALGVPLYLHPTPPPKPLADLAYAGNYSDTVTWMLTGPAWGWHVETAGHVLRLALSGAFDRFPALQLIIGHLGEMLPFMLPRFESLLPPAVTSLQRPVADYLRHNVHYTIGGFNWTSAFLDVLCQVGVDRIMFSTDHPFASMVEARAFLDHLPVSPADRERIAHGNAERLLNL